MFFLVILLNFRSVIFCNFHKLQSNNLSVTICVPIYTFDNIAQVGIICDGEAVGIGFNVFRSSSQLLTNNQVVCQVVYFYYIWISSMKRRTLITFSYIVQQCPMLITRVLDQIIYYYYVYLYFVVKCITLVVIFDNNQRIIKVISYVLFQQHN